MEESALKNTKPPKTIKAIVEDLRAKGELDEVKWEKIKSKWIKNSLISISILIASLVLFRNEFIFAFLIAILSTIYAINVLSQARQFIRLYSYCNRESNGCIQKIYKNERNTYIYSSSPNGGVIANILLFLCMLVHNKFFTKGHTIVEYEYFTNSTSHKKTGKSIIECKNSDINNLNEGDAISIFYSDTFPELSTLKIDALNQNYNLSLKGDK